MLSLDFGITYNVAESTSLSVYCRGNNIGCSLSPNFGQIVFCRKKRRLNLSFMDI